MAKSMNKTITQNGKTYRYVQNTDHIYRQVEIVDDKVRPLNLYAFSLRKTFENGKKVNTFRATNDITGLPFTTEEEAVNCRNRLLHAIEAEIEFTSTGKAQEINNNCTVNEVWLQMLKNPGSKSESTIKRYSSPYNIHISKVFGEIKVKNLMPGQIQTFLANMVERKGDFSEQKQVYAYGTVDGMAKWFKWFYSFAYTNGYMTTEQFTRFKSTKIMPDKSKFESQELPRVLSKEQINAIFSLLYNTNFYIPAIIALMSGLRPAEVFALQWEHIDTKNNKIKVRQQIMEAEGGRLILEKPKTTATIRDVSVPVELMAILAERKKDYYQAYNEAARKNRAYSNGQEVTGFELNNCNIIDNRNHNNELIRMPSDFICRDIRNGKYVRHSGFRHYSDVIRNGTAKIEPICPHIDGIKDFKFYTFRSTHISRMATLIHSPVILIKHTGHAKIDTIVQYYHNLTTDQEEMICNAVKENGSELDGIIKSPKSTLYSIPNFEITDEANEDGDISFDIDNNDIDF